MKLMRVMTLLCMMMLLTISCQKKQEEAKEQEKKPVAEKKAPAKGEEVFDVELGKAAQTGPEDAAVTIINFSDFQCPFSKRSYDLFKKVMTEYKGKVRYVFKHFPLGFHKEAKPAAKAAIAAQNQGKFWEMYEKLFQNQKTINQENLKVWAKEIGLDMEQFEKDFTGSEADQQLKDDMKQGAQFGIRGTPTVFVNGVRIVGANTPKINSVIKTQIAEGEKLKAKGVKNIYETLTKNGLKKYTAPKRKPPKIAKDIYKVMIPAHAPVKGKEDAPVTLVIFDDFECPFCARHHGTTDKLMKKYPDTLKVVYLHNPLGFHKKAKIMAMASVAAQNQGKFWEMYDLFFKEQKVWKKEQNLEEYIISAAKKIGLDIEKFKKEMKSAKARKQVESDLTYAAKLGSRGTPGNFINGRSIAGAYPFESFVTVIDEELERAKPFIEKGLKGMDLYKELVKDGKPAVVRKKKNSKNEDPNKVYKVSFHGKEPVKGKKDAAVTIVEFSEHQCPFCKKAAQTVDEITKEYQGKVKLVFKHMPLGFHKQAKPAALFSIAVKKLYGDDKFYAVSDHLFKNQREWKADYPKYFKEYAGKLGFDWAKVEKEMNSEEAKKILEQDMQEASKHGVRGVPAFFINGKKLVGAQPKAKFKQFVEAALNKK